MSLSLQPYCGVGSLLSINRALVDFVTPDVDRRIDAIASQVRLADVLSPNNPRILKIIGVL